MNPEQVVELQFELYNKKDLDAFIDLFSDDATLKSFETGNVIAQGVEEIRARYSERFKTPNLKAELKSRIAIGSTVIDHEVISGIKNDPIEAVAIYTIKDSKISSISFFGL